MKSVLLLIALYAMTTVQSAGRKGVLPVFTLDPKRRVLTSNKSSKYLPFTMLVDPDKDTSEYWRETEILSLIRSNEEVVDYERCAASSGGGEVLKLASSRNVRPICRNNIDSMLCPQCAHLSNVSECELFRESCREKRVPASEYDTYCDKKYGKWRTVFIPADYSRCRCCDECVFYRELDQSCQDDEFNFDMEEFLPVSTIDFRAGCNPYWGHPEQETLALRCDSNLRRCVPVTTPSLPKNALPITRRRTNRYEPPTDHLDCPVTCRGYWCPSPAQHEQDCPAGGFVPDKAHCNCCGKCSAYFQLNHKCAEFKKTVHNSSEIEVEEEFLEPGCDDGLVCRQGTCQDIHSVPPPVYTRKRNTEDPAVPNEPCKTEMKIFKKKYGPDGHLHYEAPQCTPLWLYAPVQCRRFMCYCALEDGTVIQGIKVPRVEVSNMNCDCAREKCRLRADVECDGFGNYKGAMFTPHVDEWRLLAEEEGDANVDEPSGPEQTSAPSS